MRISIAKYFNIRKLVVFILKLFITALKIIKIKRIKISPGNLKKDYAWNPLDPQALNCYPILLCRDLLLGLANFPSQRVRRAGNQKIMFQR